MNIAIIGGGVSGVFLSTLLKKSLPNINVTIFESNERILKKLLATGNGRCNYSNIEIGFNNFYGDVDFLKKNFSDADLKLGVEELEKLGIIPYIDDRGRIYPMSLQSSTVVNLLLDQINRNDIKIINNFNVDSIIKENNKFIVNNLKEKFDIIVISTGGLTFINKNVKNSGYDILKFYNHRVSELSPVIGPVQCNFNYLKELKGIKVPAEIYLSNGSKYFGDVLFNDKGISGNVVFQLSSEINRLDDKSISINFIPFLEKKSIAEIVISRLYDYAFISVEDLFRSIVHKKILEVILKFNNIKLNCMKSCIDKEFVFKILETMMSFKINDVSFYDWKNSQVTAGGVILDDFNKYFESNYCENLYAVGEILNIDGICGGYNIMFALFSAFFAMKGILKKCSI